MTRLAAIGALLLMLVACGNDPATTFASGVKSWCRSSDNCTDHTRN